MSWPWSQLGLSGPSDLPEIRHAYAEKLKTTHPEEDPKGFQRLHAAYQEASRQARQAARQAREEPRPAPEKPPRASREERGGEGRRHRDHLICYLHFLDVVHVRNIIPFILLKKLF